MILFIFLKYTFKIPIIQCVRLYRVKDYYRLQLHVPLSYRLVNIYCPQTCNSLFLMYLLILVYNDVASLY